MNLAVGILIGGKSRRMGTAKALLPLDGCTLLERTVEVARNITDDVLLLGQPHFDLPPSLQSVAVIPDHRPNLGPIGGLESLLLSRPGSCCILLACDMPNLTSAFLDRLVANADECDAVVFTTIEEPSWHPCCALYQPTCLPFIQAAIEARRYGMVELLSRLCVRRIELKNEEARAVENWNEPADIRSVARGSCS
jgi:molybdopterin-guanine dinucleotide biosynthesis protein A